MEALWVSAIALFLGFLGGIAGGVAVLRNSGPVATSEGLARLARLEADWLAWRTGAEAVLEQVAELEEVIERKRRRVAARESIEKRADAAQSNGTDRRAMLERARALGHPV